MPPIDGRPWIIDFPKMPPDLDKAISPQINAQ
jgi:hypothetical protein